MSDKGVRCPYCLEFFLDDKNKSYHFVSRHFYIVRNTSCPICNIKCLDILKHVHKIHKEYCVYCLQLDPTFSHYVCADYITQATSAYFEGDKISINSPGKK